MADENKKVSAENTKPAKQVKDKKAEKPAKTAKVKDKKPNVFVRMGRSIKKFFKELRGESKKVVWPDRKTVLKSSLIDTGLSELVKLLINLASKSGGGAGAATAGAITANFFSL